MTPPPNVYEIPGKLVMRFRILLVIVFPRPFCSQSVKFLQNVSQRKVSMHFYIYGLDVINFVNSSFLSIFPIIIEVHRI